MNLEACPMVPTAHQLTAIEKIVAEPFVFLTDEMGMGKSKSVIDSASVLHVQNKIDTVLIVAPASVKSVWLDPELGQLATHAWPTIANTVTHYHARRQQWLTGHGAPGLLWIVTNYEYIRHGMKGRSRYLPPALETLMMQCTDRTLLVLDESTAVKTGRALQTRACMWLRKRCGRVVLMTGTPIAHSPMDLLSQANMLHPSILSDRVGEYTNLLQFRSRYCDMGGFQGKQVIRFRNLEDLQARLKPHTLRRLKVDCLDLPPKLAPVPLTVPLTPKTWAMYKRMRDHAIVELSGEVSVASQAVTKLIRLSQLTSGFLGGLAGTKTEETSSEKIAFLTDWLTARLDEDPTFKVVIWTQFRHDVARLRDALASLPMEVGTLWGGSSTEERHRALRLLHPSRVPSDPASAPTAARWSEAATAVIGTPQSGSMGITLAAASNVVYLNNAYSLNIRQQSEDRTHRPGQTRAVSYFDVLAEGPTGQRTIDHIVLKALREKRELAEWTASAWLEALKEQKGC
jgi:SNF2 family DNA or RNA helicase